MRNFGIHFAPRSGFLGAKAAAGEHRQPRSPQAPAAVSIQAARVGLSGGNPERPLSRHGARNTGADPIQLAASKSSGSPASMLGTRWHPPGARNEGALLPLPRGSLIDPGSSPLESDDFAYAMRDCMRVVGAALFLTVTALAMVASVFMMFFCEF